MSAKHALLGLLLDRPAYPYQLADRLQRRLGPAWNVNSGQLYQLVKRLEQDGLIERVPGTPAPGTAAKGTPAPGAAMAETPAPGTAMAETPAPGTAEAGTPPAARGRSKREERHVYSITDGGVTEFERWFDQGATGVRLCRRPLLLKITFAGPERMAEARAKLDSYERECALALTEITRRREQLPAEGPLLHADRLLLRLSLSADVFQLEGELRWARHAREMLSWLTSRQALWPGQPPPGEQRAQERPGAGARDQMFRRIAGASESEDGGDGQAGGGAGEQEKRGR